MNWSYIAVQRLKAYETRKIALENIPEKIKMLNEQFSSIRSATTDGMPVQENGNHREDMLIENIAMRDELKTNYSLVKREINLTEKGLEALTKEEYRILELFYMTKHRERVDRICDELFISKTELYRRKDEALRKFTIACYGIIEI